MTLPPDTSKRVRFGLIGYGAWGSHHAAAIAADPGAELVAIAAASEKSRTAARERHPHALVVADYRQMLRLQDIEAVDIVLPTDLHGEATCAALQAGKHVLLEKPMALDLRQCDELIRTAREQRRLLAIGHEFRLSSLWGKVKEMIDAGAIGEPRYALVELWRNPYRTGSGGWRYDPRRVGSWILEEPIHFFDLARWYFAPRAVPVSVHARASAREARQAGLCDNFSATVGFSNGGYAVVTQTLAGYEHHQAVKLTGTAGALWASWSGALDRTLHPTFWLRHLDGTQVREIPIPKPTGEVYELAEQVGAVVRAIREGTPCNAAPEDGRWAVALCLAAERSVASGEVVALGNRP